jgi:UDP-N-acetylglucosamine transferase subunit ALG13
VILVTVGTHGQPFHRLLDGLAPLAAMDALVVQHGNGPAPREASRAVPFLSAREIVDLVEQASAIVTHAGVGSFLVAWRAGHVPVMVPRLRSLGEHVDDHQVELTRALARQRQAIAVWDIADLAAAVRDAPPPLPMPRRLPETVEASVRRALDGVPLGAGTGRRA